MAAAAGTFSPTDQRFILKIKLSSHLSHHRGQKLTKSMTFKAPFTRTGHEFTTCRALQAVNKWAAEYGVYII